MTEILGSFLKSVTVFGAGATSVILLLLLLYFTQNRAAGVGRFIAAVVVAAIVPIKAVRRNMLRRRAERRFNQILRNGIKDRPFLSSKLSIEWQDPNSTRDSFFREQRFVISLPRDFEIDGVLLETIFLFVSRSLLISVKRFLSADQRQAVDLYFTARLLESNSPRLSQQFVLDYITEDLAEKVAKYLAIFDELERHALFEDIAVREMAHVGSKIASQALAPTVGAEVEAMLRLLIGVARRQPTKAAPLTLERSYIRLAIVLTGKSEKLARSIDPYLGYIRSALIPRQIETVYLLSDAGKRHDVDMIANSLTDAFQIERTFSKRAQLLGSAADVVGVELRAVDASILSSHLRVEDMGWVLEDTPNDAIDLRTADGSVMGSIKFVRSEGWGFIELDDPSFDADAWFSTSDFVGRPAVVGAGDSVSCVVSRDERGRYRASDLRLVLSAPRLEDTSRPSDEDEHGVALGNRHRAASGTESQIETVRMHELADDDGVDIPQMDESRVLEEISQLVISVLSKAKEEGRNTLPLSALGYRLRVARPNFSHRQYGYAGLLPLVEQAARLEPRIGLDRYENGHPYVYLVE